MSVLRLASSRSTSTWSAGCHRGQRRGPQARRRPPSRASLGSFLFDDPDDQHPHPRRQGGGHVDDRPRRRPRAAGPTGSPDRRRTRSPRSASRTAPPTTPAGRPGGEWPAPAPGRARPRVADGHRSVRRLVRIDADDHAHVYLLGLAGGDRGGHSCFRIVVLVPLSSHTAARSDQDALRSKANRLTPAAGTS